jgi:cold shock CspA family protein
MQGQITKFRKDIGYGVIAADNGRKYRFAQSQIVNPRYATIGTSVDFVLEASAPREIIVLAGSPWTTFAGTSGR